MVFNVTFNNISAISWRSVLLVEETGGHGDNLSQISDKLYYIMDWLFIARRLEPNMSCIFMTKLQLT
jgi:hypothetical protein